jgi:hypothetical protein
MLAPLPAISAEENKDKKNKVSGSDIFNFATDIVGTAVQTYGAAAGLNPIQNRQASQDIAALTQQQTPVADKYFNLQKLSGIPGLMEYLALNGINPRALNCTTLPATLYEAQNEVCRVGITGDKGPMQAQANEAYAYFDQYAKIEKLYKNYQATSNVDGQGFGYGCMKRASEVLNGFFQYRLNELKKMKTNLESINNTFKGIAKADLNSIEETTALLNGEGTDLGKKVRSRKPQLFEYGKLFGNPACSSMFSDKVFEKDGKKNGLLGIREKVNQEYIKPSGKFSAEKYTPQAHAEVEADIKKFSNDVGKQVELNFFDMITPQKKNSISGFKVSSVNDFKLNSNLFADAETKFQESKALLDEEVSKVNSELASAKVPSNVIEKIINPKAAGFSEELETIERSIKNDCLSRNLSKKFRIFDPKRSKESNKDTNDEILNQINEILASDRNFNQKMQDLKSVNGIREGRLQISITSDYTLTEVNESGEIVKKVKKAGVDTPDGYVAGVMKHCDSQFSVNKLGNKLSGKDAISKLKSLKSDFSDLSSKFASNVREEIKNKLLNCTTNTEANASTPGSCSSDVFDVKGGGFCAAKAKNCATNMKSCQKFAEDFTAKNIQERSVKVNNYKNLMEKNKNDIVALFDGVMGNFIREGEAMRAAFGAGFNAPADIKREVGDTEKDKFLEGFNNEGDVIQLENPDAFVKMFAQNIEKLETSVKEQQQQLLGGSGVDNVGGGLIGKHIEEVQAKYSEVAKQAGNLANRCLAQHDDFIKKTDQANKAAQEEWSKKTGELNDKTNQFCNKYRLAKRSESPICDGNVNDLADAVLSVANNAEGEQALSDMRQLCHSGNNEQTRGSERNYSDSDLKSICKSTTSSNALLKTKCDSWSVHLACFDKLKTDAGKEGNNFGIKEAETVCDKEKSSIELSKLGQATSREKFTKEFESKLLTSHKADLLDELKESDSNPGLQSKQMAALKRIQDSPMPSFCDSNNNMQMNAKGMQGSGTGQMGFVNPAAIAN